MPTAKPASSSADAASVNVIRPSPESSSRSAASVPTATPATSRAPAESAKPIASARPGEGAKSSAGGAGAWTVAQPGDPAGGGDAGRRRAGGGGRRGVGGLGVRLGGRSVERSGIRCCGRPMSLCRIAGPGGGATVCGTCRLSQPRARVDHGRPRSLARRPVARKGNVALLSCRGTCCTPRGRRAAARGSATPASAIAEADRDAVQERRLAEVVADGEDRARTRPAPSRRSARGRRRRSSTEATTSPSRRSSTATPAAGRPRDRVEHVGASRLTARPPAAGGRSWRSRRARSRSPARACCPAGASAFARIDSAEPCSRTQTTNGIPNFSR